jgi:RND superfamily putative drug exporter
VLGAWAAAFVIAIALTGALLPSALNSKTETTNNPESEQARTLIDERLGTGSASEVIVVRNERATVADPAFRTAVQQLADAAKATGAVRALVTFTDPGGDVLVSRDRHATLIPVVMNEDETKRIEDLVPVVEGRDGRDGFAVHITGFYTASRDFGTVSREDLSRGEIRFGVPAALIVLLLVFGTVVGAAIPMVLSITSIVVSMGLIALIGQVFQLNLFVTNMLVAMGLALGIDYSLFMVSRLREERHKGATTAEAVLTVADTATRAVLFSGIAVALAMVGMLLVPDTILRSLAAGAIVVSLVSVVAALTFHPALLVALGDRVERLRVPVIGAKVAASAGAEGRFWGSAVRAVLRRPALSLTVSVVLLLAAASPVLDLRIGSSGTSNLPTGTTARDGLTALERDFPAGATQPVDIVVAGDPDDAAVKQGIGRLRAALAADRDFAAPAARLQTGPEIAVLSVPLVAESNSERASDAIERLRGEIVPASFGALADDVKVGGGPAANLDYYDVVTTWLPIVLAFVLGLSLVLLTLAFRSIVVPLTAIAVNLLSVGAAYGLLVLVFQRGLGADLFGFGQVERLDAWVPVFLFSVLFGLSMDYQVFLLSRIHEHYTRTGDTREAIVAGVGSTARLITGAALIIIVVFIGFATGKLVAFQQMGFGVAVALLVDATLVRMVVIPSAMGLLGDRNWYLPRALRWLPRMEIEAPSRQKKLVV